MHRAYSSAEKALFPGTHHMITIGKYTDAVIKQL